MKFNELRQLFWNPAKSKVPNTNERRTWGREGLKSRLIKKGVEKRVIIFIWSNESVNLWRNYLLLLIFNFDFFFKFRKIKKNETIPGLILKSWVLFPQLISTCLEKISPPGWWIRKPGLFVYIVFIVDIFWEYSVAFDDTGQRKTFPGRDKPKLSHIQV